MGIKLKDIIIVLNITLFSFKLCAQDSKVDSLKLALKNAKHDTTRCNILYELIDAITDDNIWPIYNDMLFEIAKKNSNNSNSKLSEKFKNFLAITYNNRGFRAEQNGNIYLAIDCFTKSLSIALEIKDNDNISSAYSNLGIIYLELGDIPKALEYSHKGLKLKEEINDYNGIANSLTNIGTIYGELKDYSKAIEYVTKALKFDKKNNDKKDIAKSYNNLGMLYISINDTVKALDYINKSLVINEEINDKSGMASSYNNISLIFNNKFDYSKALMYLHKSLKISLEINDKENVTETTDNISNVLFQNNKVNEALYYSKLSFKNAKELGYPSAIMKSAIGLKLIYLKQNKYKEALEMYELENQMHDSLNNESTKKASIKKQFQYEYEKKAAADSVRNGEEQKVKNALLTAQEAQLKQEKTKSYALYGGLVLVLVFAGFMVNRFRVTHKQKQIIELKEIETQKQNNIITHQKHLVEEKHKEITDSINYAERIQRSFLATKELLDHNLRDYFIFFQPKDVVSGDFYWASKTISSSGVENFILVTADSTGHGVPGAIMSILNISCLEKSVEEQKLVEPNEILNHTRLKIIERLKKDGSIEGGKDGMDCSLISFDFKNSKLTYAAANNPIWIIRDKQIIELSSDKMPVGKHERDLISFTQHTIDLQKGDLVYALTDGMPDQFGGPNGKKFKYKQLKELLIRVSNSPMEKQKEELETALNTWKGNLEQVDDVCLIGVRV